jgi:NAD+ synthase
MDEQTDYAHLADEIASWLREQCADAGAKGFVLGLSGGLDSAVVCALCCRAIGAERVIGAIMPSRSNPLDAEHALLVAQTYNVESVQIDLAPVTDAFMAAMPTDVGGNGEAEAITRATQLAGANVKPRLRMTTLYYLANLRNAMVVGTGNRSEAMIGYFTKYGDGGVDLLPIVDLYKRDVRALAWILGVPQPIIDKPPSAGLWPGQTDEGEMGLSYEDLDRTLDAITRGDTASIPPALLERVSRMIATSEHKRRPVPAFRRQQS